MHMSYWRFAAMIATSTVVMFGLMYLNTYAGEHVLWSETRMWMAFIMGASMAIIMLSYMLNMYHNKVINMGIYGASVLVFGGALWVVRSQATIDQVDYMRAMTPHHSIAVLTSERASIEDARVRKLADEIIEAQRREIAEMKYLIDDLQGRAPQSTSKETERPAEMVSAPAALQSPGLGKTDPETLEDQDVRAMFPDGHRCEFAYTGPGKAVFVVADTEAGELRGGLKIHNHLVELAPDSVESIAAGGSYRAEGIEFEIIPLPGAEAEQVNGVRRWPAHGIFRLEQGPEVGYRGWYRCEG